MNCGCILKCSHFFRNFRAAGENLFFNTASVYRYRELTIVRSVLEAYCQGVFRRPGYLVAVVAHVELIEVCDGEESLTGEPSAINAELPTIASDTMRSPAAPVI